MRNDRERLLDVREAIEKIEKYADRGRDTFNSDELIQTWIVHHVQIIGEACLLSSGTNTPNSPGVKLSGCEIFLSTSTSGSTEM